MQAFLSQMCIPIMLNFFIKTASIFLLPRSNFPLSMCCSLHCPTGKSSVLAQKAIQSGVKVIDLGADFRLKDSETYQQWYQVDHPCAYLLEEAVYGLPELYKPEIQNASLIANPGCYPTASILALAPLLKAKAIDPSSIIIDAKSGVSGAGRKANTATLFAECNESVKAYGVATHRHTPEIEQELSSIAEEPIALSFTPHLIPMDRGILATCCTNLSKDFQEKEIYQLYEEVLPRCLFRKDSGRNSGNKICARIQFLRYWNPIRPKD